MAFADLYARAVAMVGAAAILARRWGKDAPPQALGGAPSIPEAKPQGIPTLKMPTARGWPAGQTPVAAPGLEGQRLRHRPQASALDLGAAERRRAGRRGADGARRHPHPVRLRDLHHDAPRRGDRRRARTGSRCCATPTATASPRCARSSSRGRTSRSAWRSSATPSTSATPTGSSPSPTPTGATRITAPGQRLVDFKPGGHWTRSLLPSPDGRRLYVGVGSLSNIGESGMAVEEGRAAIYEIDLETGTARIFASGLRNPVGLAWEPTTGTLWTVVNERDGLGDETPPDYLTSVEDGGFYGWPYCYWGQTVDDRVPQDPAMVAKAISPDYALGGHTASLGLCWLPAGTLPGFPDGMVIGQHGSWNRSTLSGYRVVFVPFEGGRPAGPPRDILTGFLSPDEKSPTAARSGVDARPGRRAAGRRRRRQRDLAGDRPPDRHPRRSTRVIHARCALLALLLVAAAPSSAAPPCPADRLAVRDGCVTAAEAADARRRNRARRPRPPEAPGRPRRLRLRRRSARALRRRRVDDRRAGDARHAFPQRRGRDRLYRHRAAAAATTRACSSLDDKLSKWFPDYPKADQVTLDDADQRHLGLCRLRHRRRLPRRLLRRSVPALDAGRADRASASRRPMPCDPGTCWSYAHTNFVILGKVLEKATGRPLDDLIREGILDPLALDGHAQRGDRDHPGAGAARLRCRARHATRSSTYWDPSWTLARGRDHDVEHRRHPEQRRGHRRGHAGVARRRTRCSSRR